MQLRAAQRQGQRKCVIDVVAYIGVDNDELGLRVRRTAGGSLRCAGARSRSRQGHRGYRHKNMRDLHAKYSNPLGNQPYELFSSCATIRSVS